MSGECTCYDETGAPVNGDFSLKHENGGVERNGKCIKGKPEGEVKFYNPEGRLIRLVNFVRGKPQDNIYWYNKEGKIMHTEVYEDGEFIKEVNGALPPGEEDPQEE